VVNVFEKALQTALERGDAVFAWSERGRDRLGEGVLRTFSGRPGSGPWVGWPGQPSPVSALATPTTRSVPPTIESRSAWQARVAAAEAACRAGHFAKVVPARVQAFAPPAGHRFDPLATFRALRDRHPDEVVFLVGAGTRWFLGASPEVLARVEGGILTTHALAGTRPKPLDPKEIPACAAALLAADKDRREHALVVADLAERLAPVCSELVIEPTPRVRELPELLHLETPVQGRLRPEVGVLDVVALLHPTPALGGRPREAALAWLAAHEPFDRGAYGAPLGFTTSRNDGVFCVAIRSVLMTPEGAWAYAGAGVVAGTDPAAEWAETEAKLGTVARALRTTRAPAAHAGLALEAVTR
jgi:isochorismate synthase